ncbi:MAG TPA: thiol:disulfide interchange protein DsbA/DsbL [Rhodocyclaceae bacterium]|nr:thiol:disulfide interchange protein DsbA/DsbL [Rhodocyclaceae bacterium]
MKRRLFVSALLLASSVWSTAQAQTVGKEYTLVQPAVSTDSPGKIEVLEFFSYGCIHCYKLHPYAKQWSAKLPADVVFKRVPVTFDRPQMRPMAKLFYALEATGDLARLDDAVFAAVHDQRVNLMTDEAVTKWVGEQGVDAKKFADAYKSFGVLNKVSRAEQLTKSYRVSGTPQVYVDGRFAVRGEGVQGYADIFPVTDKLVAMARSSKR